MINKDLYMWGFNKSIGQKFCPECKNPLFMPVKDICGYCDRFKEDSRYTESLAKVNELQSKIKKMEAKVEELDAWKASHSVTVEKLRSFAEDKCDLRPSEVESAYGEYCSAISRERNEEKMRRMKAEAKVKELVGCNWMKYALELQYKVKVLERYRNLAFFIALQQVKGSGVLCSEYIYDMFVAMGKWKVDKR